jgi:hypothetical protein
MTVNRQARRIEAVGNVLKFPVSSTHVAAPGSSFKKYWFAGAVLLFAAIGGTGVVLWSLSQNSAGAAIAAAGAQPSGASSRQAAVPAAARHHRHVRERSPHVLARAGGNG